MKKALSLLLALVLCLSLCACGEDSSNNAPDGTENSSPATNESTAPTDNGPQQQETLVDYTLTIKNKANYALKDVKFSIHAADGQTVCEGVTDTTGNAKIQLDKNGEYVIWLTDVPAGYLAEDEYFFVNQTSEIVLSSQVITDSIPDKTSYQLGDIVYDFSVITTDGERFILSEALKEKKAVMISFIPGDSRDLPTINAVYSDYENDIAVIAVLAVETSFGEDMAMNIKNHLGLAFDMTYNKDIARHFCSSYLPVEIMIDRNGVLCMISVGHGRSEDAFNNAFKYFTAEDYTQRLFDDLDKIPQGFTPEECPGHSIVSGEVIMEATCTTAGTHKVYCKYCATEMEEEYYAEHNYLFGVCIDCGKKESE